MAHYCLIFGAIRPCMYVLLRQLIGVFNLQWLFGWLYAKVFVEAVHCSLEVDRHISPETKATACNKYTRFSIFIIIIIILFVTKE